MGFALSEYADWWDGQKKVSEDALTDWVQENPQWWAVAGLVQTTMDVGAGMVDVLRFGEGMAEGGWRGAGKDALRLLVILGPLGRAGGMLSRLAYSKFHTGAIRLAVATTGVTGPCTFTAVNNAMSIVAGKGKNLFLTAREAAKGLGTSLRKVSKDKLGEYEIAAWIDELVPFLRSQGARIKTFNSVNTIDEAVNIARKGDGVVIFAIKYTPKIGGDEILHSVIAVRQAGRVRFADYGNKFFNSLDDLVSRWGAPDANGISLLKDVSGATLIKYRLTALLEHAKSVMTGGIIMIEGMTAIETNEDGVDFAVPVIFAAVPDQSDSNPPPEVVKTSFEAYKAIKNGRPLIRLPEINVTVRAPRSDWLTGVQFRLNAAGFGSGAVDGIMGPITRKAVKAFQRAYPPLVVDGIPGPKTQAKLVAVCGY